MSAPEVTGAAAPKGDNYGFVVLRSGAATRRVPYAFFVTRPGLHAVTARQLRRVQEGSTRTGQSLADLYRFPAAPFGHSPDYGIGPYMKEDGGERLYSIRVRNREHRRRRDLLVYGGRDRPVLPQREG